LRKLEKVPQTLWFSIFNETNKIILITDVINIISKYKWRDNCHIHQYSYREMGRLN
jgi:hypothetical protein